MLPKVDHEDRPAAEGGSGEVQQGGPAGRVRRNQRLLRQQPVILLLGRLLFNVPIRGSILELLLMAFPFVVANLGIGLFFSTLVRTQAQAMQAGFMFIMPNILLSGFMFPFRGMPRWAQYIGELFPLTHFLRIIRGILLKGNGIEEIRGEVWQIALFAFLAVVIGVMRYRRTLD